MNGGWDSWNIYNGLLVMGQRVMGIESRVICQFLDEHPPKLWANSKQFNMRTPIGGQELYVPSRRDSKHSEVLCPN